MHNLRHLPPSASLLCLALLSPAHADESRTRPKTDPARAAEFKHFYKGPITLESVNKFIEARKAESIKKLIITSDGGDAFAGLKLGRWVKDNNLDVEVYLYCHSACANLVFLAGNKKIIGKDSFVSFHGSVEQKKLRELLVKYVQTAEKNFFSTDQMSNEDQKFLADNRNSIATLLKFRELQRQFYDELQINEYITRLGQEPVSFGLDSWTLTISAMEKFGVRNVEAAEGYGTPKYMSRFPLQVTTCKGKCMTFDLNEQGLVVRTDSNPPSAPTSGINSLQVPAK